MRFGLGLVFAAVIGVSLWAGITLRRQWNLRASPWSTVGLLSLAVLASAAGLVFALGRGNDGIMVFDDVPFDEAATRKQLLALFAETR